MRKLVWSEELQDIAQMWADQCTPGHDTNRDILTRGQVGQNVIAFKGLEPCDVTVIGISSKFSCQNNILKGRGNKKKIFGIFQKSQFPIN